MTTLGNTANTAAGSTNDLVHLSSLIASQATAQFVRGLLLGIVLTVAAALVAARMLLFHSPSSPSKHLLYRRRRRTPSTFGAATGGAAAGPAAAQGPPLPLPLSTLVLLHRQLLAADNSAPSAASSTPASATLAATASPAAAAAAPGSPAALSAAAELSASYIEGESMAFVNFVLAEVISTYRSDQRFMDWLKTDILEQAINKSLPAFVDRISVSDLSLGQHDQFPLFRRARLRPCRNDPGARAAATLRGPRAGAAHASAMNERWRIELDIEFETLSGVAKRASAVSQQQAREQQQAASAAVAAGSGGTLSRSGSLRQRNISSSHNSRSGSPRPSSIPLSAATFGNPANASSSSVNPSPLGGGGGGTHTDRPILTSATTSSLQPTPLPNLGEDSLTSEPDYSPPAFLELGLDTQLVLNWPKPGLAALPVHLMLEVTQFRATLAMEFHPHTSPDDTPVLTLSILPGYTFDFRVSSLLGSRTKLRDVPKIADLITMAVQNQLAGMLVDPAFITVPLPGVPSPRAPAAAAAAPHPSAPMGAPAGDLGHQGDDELDSSRSSSDAGSSAGNDADVDSPVPRAPRHRQRAASPTPSRSARGSRAAATGASPPTAAPAATASSSVQARAPPPPHVPAAMAHWPVPSDRDLLRSPTASPFARASVGSGGSAAAASLHLAAAAAAAVASAGGAPPRLTRASSVPPPDAYAGPRSGVPPVPRVPRGLKQAHKQQG